MNIAINYVALKLDVNCIGENILHKNNRLGKIRNRPHFKLKHCKYLEYNNRTIKILDHK